jgi:hypothetical protein
MPPGSRRAAAGCCPQVVDMGIAATNNKEMSPRRRRGEDFCLCTIGSPAESRFQICGIKRLSLGYDLVLEIGI